MELELVRYRGPDNRTHTALITRIRGNKVRALAIGFAQGDGVGVKTLPQSEARYMSPLATGTVKKALTTYARHGRKFGMTKAAKAFIKEARGSLRAAPSYADYLTESAAAGETNDCTVRALSVLTGRPYRECLEFTYKHGRKPRQGWWFNDHLDAMEKAFKVRITRVPVHDYGKTVRTFERALRKHERILVWTSRHVAGSRGGKFIDHASGGCRRVIAAWKFEDA